MLDSFFKMWYSFSMRDIQALREQHKAALEKLRAEQKAELDKVRAKNLKAQSREKQRERKVVNHAMYILAGEVIAEMKRTKNTARLRALIDNQERPRDKAALETLFKRITEATV